MLIICHTTCTHMLFWLLDTGGMDKNVDNHDHYDEIGDEDDNSAIINFQNEELQKRNKKFKLPWGFV